MEASASFDNLMMSASHIAETIEHYNYRKYGFANKEQASNSVLWKLYFVHKHKYWVSYLWAIFPLSKFIAIEKQNNVQPKEWKEKNKIASNNEFKS